MVPKKHFKFSVVPKLLLVRNLFLGLQGFKTANQIISAELEAETEAAVNQEDTSFHAQNQPCTPLAPIVQSSPRRMYELPRLTAPFIHMIKSER